MKNSRRCPKCESDNIIRVDSSVKPTVIPVSWIKDVEVVRYVCGGCGYNEEWIEDQDDIKAVAGKFSHQ